MKGSTPTQRAKSLNKILKATYDQYDRTHNNVVDMLTDLRHVCDAKDWDFAECNRIAFTHYVAESNAFPRKDQP